VNQSKQITILSIASAILFVLVLFLLYLNFQKSSSVSTTVPIPIPTLILRPTDTISVSPTAGWKTYSNALYKYELKYPSSWSVIETNGSAKSVLFPDKNKQMVEISNKTDSIKIFFEGDWDHGFEPNVPVLSTTTTIGSKKVTLNVLKQNPSENPEGGWAIYTIPNFHDFRIETVYNNDVNKILSTFKFL
jgi:hypothetical protein